MVKCQNYHLIKEIWVFRHHFWEIGAGCSIDHGFIGVLKYHFIIQVMRLFCKNFNLCKRLFAFCNVF